MLGLYLERNGTMEWLILDPRYVKIAAYHLGPLDGMLSVNDPRSVKEQLAAGYAQYGGWRPMPGFKLVNTDLVYPGDPPMSPWAATMIRDERIYVYPHDWVMIRQLDNSFEVCRMD
jgi:hypothetical protein